ncbi:hypothetical protein Fmac_021567 [Flemingia macrophylla]|uniref:RING-type E3 ubiquitin transferase n=1 Tax=Flemingia macrophylla TaxID=520843 RepID=A0ABD1LX88_9FABA
MKEALSHSYSLKPIMDITDLNDYNNSYNSDLNEKAVLISMIFLSVLMLLFVAFYICFSCIRSLHRNTVDFTANPDHDHDDDHANFSNEPCNIGLNTTIVASLPMFTIIKQTTTDGGFPMVDCVVCLCALKEGENAKLLPNCKHLFHVDCIDKWLKLRSTCPLCRAEVKPKPSFRLQSQDREGHVGIYFF